MIAEELTKLFGVVTTNTNYKQVLTDLDKKGAFNQKMIREMLLVLIDRIIEAEKNEGKEKLHDIIVKANEGYGFVSRVVENLELKIEDLEKQIEATKTK